MSLPCSRELPHLYAAPGYIPSARSQNAYMDQNLQNYLTRFVQILFFLQLQIYTLVYNENFTRKVGDQDGSQMCSLEVRLKRSN